MKKLNIRSLLMVLAAAFIAACNGPANNIQDTENTWRMGMALYSFNNLPFKDALEKVDSGHIKYVEGFSFYKLGEGYGDSTMGSLSKDGIHKMKDFITAHNTKMISMYVGGGNHLEEWKQTFELAKEFGMEYIT